MRGKIVGLPRSVPQDAAFRVSSVAVARGAYRAEQVLAGVFVVYEAAAHSVAGFFLGVVVAVCVVYVIGGRCRAVSVQNAVALFYMFVIVQGFIVFPSGDPHVGAGVFERNRDLRSVWVDVRGYLVPFLFFVFPDDGKAVFRQQLEIGGYDMGPDGFRVFVVQGVDRIVPVAQFEQRAFFQRGVCAFGSCYHVLGIPCRTAIDQIVGFVALPYEYHVVASIVVIFDPDNGIVVSWASGGKVYGKIDFRSRFAVYGVVEVFRFPGSSGKFDAVAVVFFGQVGFPGTF